MVLLLSGRGNGRLGEGGGGALTGVEDSVVPAGARGWESRAPILGMCLVAFTLLVRRWLERCR